MDGSEQVEECPICLKPFKDPRSLPCHHIFCTECLQNCINTVGFSDNYFQCPFCRSLAGPNNVYYLPSNILAKAFPMVKSTDTKKENPCPSYCVACMKKMLYVDAVDIDNNLCYGCHDGNNEQQEKLKDQVAQRTQTLSQNAVAGDLLYLFCMKCFTFSEVQGYAFKHAVCNEENAVKSIPDAANEIRAKMKSVIENMDNIIGKFSDIMNALSTLGQKWQHVDFETMVIFSMDENIQESYGQQLEIIDEMMLEIQRILKKVCDDLEDQKVQQKIEDNFIYLQIKSLTLGLKKYDDLEELFNHKLPKITEKIKNSEQVFQALKQTLNLNFAKKKVVVKPVATPKTDKFNGDIFD